MTRHALEDADSADLVPVEVVLNSLKQEILTIIKTNETSEQTFKILAGWFFFLGGGCGIGVGWYSTHWYLM